jgi:hypothetical protein
MKFFRSYCIGAFLLTKASAASEDVPAPVSHAGQYCIGKTGGSLFNDDPVPTVTIIYSGTTTVTTLATFTNCEDGHHKLPEGSLSRGVPLASITESQNAADGSTSAGRGDSARSSQPADTVPSASALVSQQLPAPNAASASTSFLAQSMTPSGGNTFVPSSLPPASGSGANMKSGLAGVSDDPRATKPSPHSPTPTSDDAFGGESGVPKSAATDQSAPRSGGTQLNSNAWATGTPSGASTQAVATPGLLSPAGPRVSGGTAGSWNSTLTLSPAVIDALQLAQFVKNLGASVFNASHPVTVSMAADSGNSTSLTELITNISLVSTDLVSPSQSKALQRCVARTNAAGDSTRNAPSSWKRDSTAMRVHPSQ